VSSFENRDEPRFSRRIGMRIAVKKTRRTRFSMYEDLRVAWGMPSDGIPLGEYSVVREGILWAYVRR